MRKIVRIEKCSTYDASLHESARIDLRRGNKFICICVHCRAQAPQEKDLRHTAMCCFRKKAA